MTRHLRAYDYEVKGKIDWKAFREARLANGEICTRCERPMTFPTGSPRECDDCKDLQSDLDEVTHDTLIRCPKCGHTAQYRELHGEGPHSICCDECEQLFEITVNYSISYNSPPMLGDR